ncbi:MAG TPA: dihydropteroate synthase, partial [Rhodanobacteraceae bacterium]
SFSGDGLRDDVKAAVGCGLEMVEGGADLLDVGAESTRPGAQPVSIEDEIARVVPVIGALVRETDVPVSIDTSKPEVIRAVVPLLSQLLDTPYYFPITVAAMRLDPVWDPIRRDPRFQVLLQNATGNRQSTVAESGNH